MIFSIVAQGILFGVLFKLLLAFKGDREKPLDLFLTIKKQKFEQLKEASELFLNRLLLMIQIISNILLLIYSYLFSHL